MNTEDFGTQFMPHIQRVFQMKMTLFLLAAMEHFSDLKGCQLLDLVMW
jgi:hypothetical protein